MNRKLRIHALFTLAFLLTSAIAFGAEKNLNANGAVNELTPYFRMLWGLCIVLGVMLVLYGLVRKKFNILASRSGDAIKIVEIKPVMPKKSLCLVNVKGREYLLGIGNESITLLADTGLAEKKSFQDVLDQSGTEKS